jgi:hypothetical protein
LDRLRARVVLEPLEQCAADAAPARARVHATAQHAPWRVSRQQHCVGEAHERVVLERHMHAVARDIGIREHAFDPARPCEVVVLEGDAGFVEEGLQQRLVGGRVAAEGQCHRAPH